MIRTQRGATRRCFGETAFSFWEAAQAQQIHDLQPALSMNDVQLLETACEARFRA